jgi:hypothetical protein
MACQSPLPLMTLQEAACPTCMVNGSVYGHDFPLIDATFDI